MLLLEVVLGLLAIELQQHLACRDPVSQVGRDAAHPAFGLGRHGDLVFGRERADHLDGAAYRFLANLFNLHRNDRIALASGLGRSALAAGGDEQDDDTTDDDTKDTATGQWHRWTPGF